MLCLHWKPAIFGFVALAVVPAVLPDAFSLSVFTLALLAAACSLAWNLCGGYAGQLSLGHAAFYRALRRPATFQTAMSPRRLVLVEPNRGSNSPLVSAPSTVCP